MWVLNAISANNIYTSFPVGVMAGYGYKLFENKNWSMAPLLDIQWLDSKTQHQSKPTHYFDFSLNYQLSFIRWKKIQLNSSFGYGCFIKRFYNTYFTNWEKSYGISGLFPLVLNMCFNCAKPRSLEITLYISIFNSYKT